MTIPANTPIPAGTTFNVSITATGVVVTPPGSLTVTAGNITFPTAGTYTIQLAMTFVATPATTTGTVTINAIGVGGATVVPATVGPQPLVAGIATINATFLVTTPAGGSVAFSADLANTSLAATTFTGVGTAIVTRVA